MPGVGACGGLLGLTCGLSAIAKCERADPATISRVVRLSHAQAAATSPDLKLIIALDHLLSGVTTDSKHYRFSCQEKSELIRQKFHN